MTTLDKTLPIHGGSDALGAARWDFSTNSHAGGPCQQVVQALAQVNATRYPDPAYAGLRQQLAARHGVAAERVLVGVSGSELIARITACVAARQPQARVWLPPHHYGDYATQAMLHGLQRTGALAQADLVWLCAPSSPLGQDMDCPDDWAQLSPQATVVLDCAYAPLQLEGPTPLADWLARDQVWQTWTPNKSLGLCGVRAAYVIAPAAASVQQLQAMWWRAPSWPLGAHGVALLQAWCEPAVQDWLATSLETLRDWKQQQLDMLQALGWQCLPSLTNFLLCRPPPLAMGWDAMLQALRAEGIKLRDCASFGLPGHVRLCVHEPAAQQALQQAWLRLQEVSA